MTSPFTLFQLNIWYGSFLPEIIRYIQDTKPDIVTLQEVASPTMKIYKHGDIGVDCYPALVAGLPEYVGVFFPVTTHTDVPGSYFGQATFVRKPLTIIAQDTLYLRPAQTLTRADCLTMTAEKLAVLTRSCGFVTIQNHAGESLVVGNVHGPWGADSGRDSEEKTTQYAKLATYLKTLTPPWIVAGDFNMPVSTQAISHLSQLGINLTVQYGVTNTMNPATSKVFAFMPEGTAIDHLITSPDLMTDTYTLVTTPTLSDHFGITATIH